MCLAISRNYAQRRAASRDSSGRVQRNGYNAHPTSAKSKGAGVDEKTDVLIVGGGPAGLAAGITARKYGFRVMIVDAAAPPIDKACGEGLLPDTVEALARLGISFLPSEGSALRGIRFLDGEDSGQAYFPAGPAVGVRRTTLHQKMVDHAADCGVRLLWRTHVTGLNGKGVFLDGTQVYARWIIGADGANSFIRRWIGLDCSLRVAQRFAYRRHYRVRPWTDCVEVYWGQGLQAYITPVGSMEVCAAVISRNPRLRLDKALRALPGLAARLGQGEPTSAQRGGVTSMLRLPRVCRRRVALIGDASGCVDAITGEGLGLAFRQAAALADALAANDLGRYETAHRRLIRRPYWMGKSLLELDARPSLRQHITRIFAKHPQLFARFVAAHVGARSGADVLAMGALLGWNLLIA